MIARRVWSILKDIGTDLSILVFVFLSWVSVAFAAPNMKPNVVLLVIDTLRSDHLPFYGYKRDTAPFLSSLAKQGWVFENNFSTSSWTAPASASILTSLYPFQHGVIMGRSATRRLQRVDLSTKLNKISQRVETVAETLQSHGYTTFGVVDNGNLRPDAGFAQGFKHYRVFKNEGGERLTATVKEWKGKIKKSTPYFLYMQYMDPHHPYRRRDPWFNTYLTGKKKGVKKLLAAYDSEIRFVDAQIEQLYKLLAWDTNTIIVLTSDHGEEFFDHKKLGHGKSLYSEVVRVPLMVYDSRKKYAAGRFSANTSILDVVPTVLELAAVTSKAHHEGKSLVGLTQHPSKSWSKEPTLYSHLWKKMPKGEEVLMYSTVFGNQRFISTTKPKVRALFNIQADPGERRNMIKKEARTAAELEQRYFAFEQSAKKFPREWADTNLLEERDHDDDE